MSPYTPVPATTIRAVTNPLPQEIASLGPVHLEVTDLGLSTSFWHRVVGLHIRSQTPDEVQLGTTSETLVVLHPGAQRGFLARHSGLYHLAIHPPNQVEFARIAKRIIESGMRVSPTDHTMSKALYVLDPDGITVEITLETPERLQAMTIKNGPMQAIHVDGSVRGGSERLDLRPVLATLEGQPDSRLVAEGTKIGHVHLHVGDLLSAHQFYRTIGFNQALWAPAIGFSDLGAGGAFNHRIALNTWQGIHAPQSPEGSARMRHFTIKLDSARRLDQVLAHLPSVPLASGEGHLLQDPAGNRLVLLS